MEENKQTFNEILDRIKGMMNYDPEIPLTEQSIRDLRNVSKSNRKGEMTYPALRFQQQLIMRNMRELSGTFKRLQGKTYEGHDVIELIKNAYKEKTGKDMVIPESIGKNSPPQVDAVSGVDAPVGNKQSPDPTIESPKPLEVGEVGYTNIIKRI